MRNIPIIDIVRVYNSIALTIAQIELNNMNAIIKLKYNTWPFE